ncbi:LuxR family transcriptional regulator [Pseudomonas sp. SDO55104_S430]
MEIDGEPDHNNSPTFISRLKSTLEMEIQEKGFLRFTYFIVRKTNLKSAFLISNYPPGWVEEYMLRSHYLTDPVIQRGLRTVAPFFWRECRIKDGDYNSINSKTMKHSPLTGGYCFTLHDANGCFSLLNVGDRFDPALLRIREQHKAELQMLLIRFHQRIIFSPQILEFIFSERKRKSLTSREQEILKWACIGKTYTEISLITGISVRTVKFHMRNIVEKLDVSNAKHAISKAQQEGLCIANALTL